MLKAFQIEDEPERIDVIYLDTPARDCLRAGWVSRIRVKEGKPRYTITYKMRYPVQDGDVDSALATARADGLTLQKGQYPAEIDWGYSKMTLSFAANADVKTEKTPDLSLLSPTEAVQMAVTVRLSLRIIACCYSNHILICPRSQRGQSVDFHRACIGRQDQFRPFQHQYPCAFRKLPVETDHGTDFHGSPSEIQLSDIEILPCRQHFFIIKSADVDLGIMEDLHGRKVTKG